MFQDICNVLYSKWATSPTSRLHGNWSLYSLLISVNSVPISAPVLEQIHSKKVSSLFFHLHFFIYLLIFGCFEPQLTCSVSLQEEWNCSSAMVSNHISSLLYPIKFVHREHAPDFKGLPITCQLNSRERMWLGKAVHDRRSFCPKSLDPLFSLGMKTVFCSLRDSRE